VFLLSSEHQNRVLSRTTLIKGHDFSIVGIIDSVSCELRIPRSDAITLSLSKSIVSSFLNLDKNLPH